MSSCVEWTLLNRKDGGCDETPTASIASHCHGCGIEKRQLILPKYNLCSLISITFIYFSC